MLTFQARHKHDLASLHKPT